MKKLYLLVVVPLFLLSSSSDDISRLKKLAYSYENGEGVAKDLKKAKEYYIRAAKLGSKDAKLSLTLLELEEGIGSSVSLDNSVNVKSPNDFNIEFSAKELKETINKAKKGDKEALYTLAVVYENGYGVVKKDRVKAIKLYKKAYELGSKKAQKELQIIGEI